MLPPANDVIGIWNLRIWDSCSPSTFTIVSTGGVHSHLDHLFGLLEFCKYKNFDRVYIHAFTDGRDTSPTSGINYIKELEDKIKEMETTILSGNFDASPIGTISGSACQYCDFKSICRIESVENIRKVDTTLNTNEVLEIMRGNCHEI